MERRAETALHSSDVHIEEGFATRLPTPGRSRAAISI